MRTPRTPLLDFGGQVDFPTVFLGSRGPVSTDTRRRFARLFSAAWHRLPAPCPEILLTHWTRRPGSPSVVLSARPLSPGEGIWTFADCARDGHTLRFAAAVVECLGDEGVQTLVAHELAHAMQIALRWPPDEEQANAWARRWGFDLRAIW